MPPGLRKGADATLRGCCIGKDREAGTTEQTRRCGASAVEMNVENERAALQGRTQVQSMAT